MSTLVSDQLLYNVVSIDSRCNMTNTSRPIRYITHSLPYTVTLVYSTVACMQIACVYVVY